MSIFTEISTFLDHDIFVCIESYYVGRWHTRI